MTISLPPDLQRLVDEKVCSGMYGSRDEVIQDALRLLKERDQRLEDLRKEIRIGMDQADRGEAVPMDVEDMKRRLGRRLAEQAARPDE